MTRTDLTFTMTTHGVKDMSISVEEIKKIIDDASSNKMQIKVSDIAYILLSRSIKDKKVVFTVIFGKDFSDNDVETYDRSSKVKYLRKYMNSKYPEKTESVQQARKNKFEDISFEENKEALIKMLAEIEQAEEEGRLEYKDAAKMRVDIRTRLNDKFAVSEKTDDQKVMVITKFNTICEKTHTECWLQTKEYAIEHWGLTDLEELKKEYDLVPKTNIKEDE